MSTAVSKVATNQTHQEISSEELRELALSGETAVIDIREGSAYDEGHISVAVPVLDSELELRIGNLVPRRSTPVVIVDQEGGKDAVGAAARLIWAGYSDVRVLSGGIAGWTAAGYILIDGPGSVSKALGELVERYYDTPKVTVEELKADLDGGEDIVVIDTRPIPEFTYISIPTGQVAPGVEVLFRAYDLVPSPATKIIVNCAGRTRGIIGAQALINAGLPNPIFSLENGTTAWRLAGYEPARGADATFPRPSAESLDRAEKAAQGIRDRFGVQVIGDEELAALQAESDERTLYVFDVRTAEEYAKGHFPGARSLPGGQLVQATDGHIAVWRGRFVLVDDLDAVRASLTASWLVQLGINEVFVYPAGPDKLTERTAPRVPDAIDEVNSALVSPDELAAKLANGETISVVDVAPPLPYYVERRFVPGSVFASRTLLRKHPELLAGKGPVVLTSSDGRLARLAARELDALLEEEVVALEGGTEAWIAAGQPHESGPNQPGLVAGDVLQPEQTLEERRAHLSWYVAWGDDIVERLEQDGLFKFRRFNEATV